jgi:hypothetical protein
VCVCVCVHVRARVRARVSTQFVAQEGLRRVGVSEAGSRTSSCNTDESADDESTSSSDEDPRRCGVLGSTDSRILISPLGVPSLLMIVGVT